MYVCEELSPVGTGKARSFEEKLHQKKEKNERERERNNSKNLIIGKLCTFLIDACNHRPWSEWFRLPCKIKYISCRQKIVSLVSYWQWKQSIMGSHFLFVTNIFIKKEYVTPSILRRKIHFNYRPIICFCENFEIKE